MSESLRSILLALDHARVPSWTQYRMRDWPTGEFERCLASGLFLPQEPTDQIPCTVCGEIVDVLRFTKPNGEIEACLKCSLCGNHRVPFAMAGRWELNLSRFVMLLATALDAAGGTQMLVRDRVWRLGKCRLAGSSRNAYLARRLQHRDAREVIEAASFPPGAVLFVPRVGPWPELRIEPLPLLIPLNEVLDWHDSRFVFDRLHVEGQLVAKAALIDSRRPPTKRATRLSVIESLRHELVEHLRSARDHALTTLRATGTPHLLPRPTHELLAKQLGVHRTTVSRCLEDGSAPELVSLWELADDLDRVLAGV